jgi:hypothetical protein
MEIPPLQLYSKVIMDIAKIVLVQDTLL